MLNIIHQNGTQKLESGNYFVEKTPTPPSAPGMPKEKDPGTYSIFAYVNGLDVVEVARYDKEIDANRVFAQMVVLEGNTVDVRAGIVRPSIAVLPEDDPQEIKHFLKSQYGYNLFKGKHDPNTIYLEDIEGVK